jgi:hypothetical protein
MNMIIDAKQWKLLFSTLYFYFLGKESYSRFKRINHEDRKGEGNETCSIGVVSLFKQLF